MPVIKALVKNAKKVQIKFNILQLHFMMELHPPKKKKDFWMEKAV